MEITKNITLQKPIKAVLFDFDGTLSTLRHGWNVVMREMMLEMIPGPSGIVPGLEQEVESYIALSTGLQTIHQMQWLSDAVARYGKNSGASSDPWWYKAQFRVRLMKMVDIRKQALASGEQSPESFLIRGSKSFLSSLKDKGLDLFVASGTDYPDVVREAELLGIDGYFTQISGSPDGRIECPKTAVINKILNGGAIQPQQLAVFGDGPVELELAVKSGALAVGVASDEDRLHGIDPVKRERLMAAGAHVIIGDYGSPDEVLRFMKLS